MRPGVRPELVSRPEGVLDIPVTPCAVDVPVQDDRLGASLWSSRLCWPADRRWPCPLWRAPPSSCLHGLGVPPADRWHCGGSGASVHPSMGSIDRSRPDADRLLLQQL